MTEKDEFILDQKFLQKHINLVMLNDPASSAQVLVSPDLQGRVMTSTAGTTGKSYGWINKKLFESGDTLEHMNAFGGEERFWLGPEGGQYSIFFKQDDPFDFDHWQTPRLIDLDHYPVKSKNHQKITFEKEAQLTNYSGFTFNFRINRSIEILSPTEMLSKLGLSPETSVAAVGYQTTNSLTNTGDQDWKENSGLLSIWLLGMYNPSESTTIIIPYEEGTEEQLGTIVNDTYFGKVPSERLKIDSGLIFFKGDGKSRGKIGLNPRRAKNICGAYDAENQILTIVQYQRPAQTDRYVNSLWEIQDEPYSGDVVNSYNDGPPEPGKEAMGPFYEIETSSPALALKKGETGIHIQTTYHFEGTEKEMDSLLNKLFGITLSQLKAVF
ncbi:MAG: hypothetical protein KDC53_17925 [Saprospiraceae bacterium]|nr:hypothetical protein [Saprospiraceae bacterium]